ncbi:MAG: hypothetical protein ACRDPA_17630 [Solirubrobacteraceae bacterium]
MNAPRTVNVHRTLRAAREGRLPRGGERFVCPTLDAAVRLGHRYAADGEGYELVGHDAQPLGTPP